MIFRKTKHKFGAKRTDGFPSKLEAAVFQLLTLREKAGEIRDIARQHTIVLQDGPPNERIAWKVDFAFTETSSGETVLAEAKGVATDEFRLKLKLYRRVGLHRLEIWKGDYRRPLLAEIVTPKGYARAG